MTRGRWSFSLGGNALRSGLELRRRQPPRARVRVEVVASAALEKFAARTELEGHARATWRRPADWLSRRPPRRVGSRASSRARSVIHSMIYRYSLRRYSARTPHSLVSAQYCKLCGGYLLARQRVGKVPPRFRARRSHASCSPVCKVAADESDALYDFAPLQRTRKHTKYLHNIGQTHRLPPSPSAASNAHSRLVRPAAGTRLAATAAARSGWPCSGQLCRLLRFDGGPEHRIGPRAQVGSAGEKRRRAEDISEVPPR